MSESGRPAEITVGEHETIRRAMLRAHTAVALVLAALLTLALAAVLASVRALRNQERAVASERERREQLWQAYLEQARANRLSGLAGSRLRALAAISNAASIRPALELRNEAIACLSTLDVEVGRAPGDQLQGEVKFFDVAPDLKTFARLLSSGRLEIRQMVDEASITNFSIESILGTNRIVTWLRYSPTGEYVALGCLDSSVVVWRLTDGYPVLVHRVRRTGYLIPPAFSPDGRWIAYFDPTLSNTGGLALRELKSGRSLNLPDATTYDAVAVAPDKPWVAVGKDRSVRLINFETSETERTLEHPADVGRIEWSHDGRRLVVGCVSGDLFLWNLPQNDFHALTGHTEYVGSLFFSPDDRLLVSSGNDRTTRLWDTGQGREVWRTLDGEGLRFSNDGTQIAFARGAAGVGTWRLVTPASIRALPLRASNNEPNRPIDLSPDGRWLAALVPTGLQIWDLQQAGREFFERLPSGTSRQRFPSSTVNFHPTELGL